MNLSLSEKAISTWISLDLKHEMYIANQKSFRVIDRWEFHKKKETLGRAFMLLRISLAYSLFIFIKER